MNKLLLVAVVAAALCGCGRKPATNADSKAPPAASQESEQSVPPAKQPVTGLPDFQLGAPLPKEFEEAPGEDGQYVYVDSSFTNATPFKVLMVSANRNKVIYSIFLQDDGRMNSSDFRALADSLDEKYGKEREHRNSDSEYATFGHGDRKISLTHHFGSSTTLTYTDTKLQGESEAEKKAARKDNFKKL